MIDVLGRQHQTTVKSENGFKVDLAGKKIGSLNIFLSWFATEKELSNITHEKFLETIHAKYFLSRKNRCMRFILGLFAAANQAK